MRALCLVAVLLTLVPAASAVDVLCDRAFCASGQSTSTADCPAEGSSREMNSLTTKATLLRTTATVDAYSYCARENPHDTRSVQGGLTVESADHGGHEQVWFEWWSEDEACSMDADSPLGDAQTPCRAGRPPAVPALLP